MPSDAIKSDIYKWMLVDKNNLHITPLEFLSMTSAGPIEERFFRQGYLSFDSDQAVYIRESSSVQNILRRKEIDDLPESIVGFIQRNCYSEADDVTGVFEPRSQLILRFNS